MNNRKIVSRFISLILSALAILLFSSSLVFSLTPNIVLSSQNPDPVKPGNYVDLSIKVTNQGTSPINDAQIELVENRYVTLSASEEKVSNVGAIPTQSTNQEGFVIVRKRVFIDENAPLGNLFVDIKVKSGSSEISKSLPIVVRDSKPSLQVITANSIEDVTYYPGELKPFTLTLSNTNAISLQNIRLTLFDSNSDEISSTQVPNTINTDSDAFFITQSTNAKRVQSINSNDEVEVSFNLGVSPNAQIRPYQIPLKIEYEDTLGNSYTEEIEFSILVNSEQNVYLTLDRISNEQVIFGIANPGPGVVKGALVSLYSQDNEKISSQYLGDLNSDDFQTIQFDTNSLNTNSSQNVKLVVEFSDGFYNPKTIEEDFTLDFNPNAQNSNSYVSTIIILLVIGLIGYYIYHKRKKSSNDD